MNITYLFHSLIYIVTGVGWVGVGVTSFSSLLISPTLNDHWGGMGRGGDPPPPPHLSNSGWPFRGGVYFVIVFLVGQGWTPVQKKLTELEIYLFLLYSCSKILVYMMLSNRIINTQIWCLLLDQVCPNEHHLPVPFPHIQCDRSGMGRDGGSTSSSSSY